MFKGEPLTPPKWPETSPEMLADIGRCIIAWGVLEREIGFAIEDCLQLDDDLGMSVSANLAASGKINLLRSLIGSLDDAFEKSVHEALDKLAGQTHEAAQSYRDFLAHGQPWPVKMPDGEIWVWAKWSARKGGLKANIRRMREGDFKHMADELTSLVAKWHVFRESMQEGVGLLKLMKKG